MKMLLVATLVALATVGATAPTAAACAWDQCFDGTPLDPVGEGYYCVRRNLDAPFDCFSGPITVPPVLP